MKRLSFIAASLLLCTTMSAKSALVVIAHGSPSDSWNSTVMSLEEKLNKVEIPGISYKRVAMMEFSRPDIASVMKDCEKEHIDTVFALPLFISPSSHSEDDIPNILGLKFTPSVHEDLKEEGINMVKTKMHIITGPTLMESGIIEKSMAERVKALSENPEDEALVILAHGDPDRRGMWERIMNSCTNTAKEEGFDYIDYQLIGMGQNFSSDVTPLLKKAKKAKKRVIVQGIYLVSTVNSMARKSDIKDDDIVFGSEGILPLSESEVLKWIISTTEKWIAEN